MGRGRPRTGRAKRRCEAYDRICIHTLNRQRQISPKRRTIRVNNGFGIQNIQLSWTKPVLGGVQPWFICPECVGRFAHQYLGNRGLACRWCYKLAYACENEQPRDRARRKVEKLCKWLVGHSSAAELKRPRGMHRRTFERWQMKYRFALAAAHPDTAEFYRPD